MLHPREPLRTLSATQLFRTSQTRDGAVVSLSRKIPAGIPVRAQTLAVSCNKMVHLITHLLYLANPGRRDYVRAIVVKLRRLQDLVRACFVSSRSTRNALTGCSGRQHRDDGHANTGKVKPFQVILCRACSAQVKHVGRGRAPCRAGSRAVIGTDETLAPNARLSIIYNTTTSPLGPNI